MTLVVQYFTWNQRDVVFLLSSLARLLLVRAADLYQLALPVIFCIPQRLIGNIPLPSVSHLPSDAMELIRLH